jgi:hypothetical protein
MGIFSATIGGSQASPLLMYSLGTTVKPTEPAPITFAAGDMLRFVELSVPGVDGSIRIEWVPVPNFSTGIGLPVSLIIGTDPPKAAVLKGDRFVENEASDEPLMTDEMSHALMNFKGPFETVFAPKDGRTPPTAFFNSPDDESFAGTVGDYVSAWAGIGALGGAAAGIPLGPPGIVAGAARGGAVGAAAGALAGIAAYLLQ